MRALVSMLVLGVVVAVALASCRESPLGATFDTPFTDASTPSTPPEWPGLSSGDAGSEPLSTEGTIAPPDPVVTVTAGQVATNVQFAVKTTAGMVLPATFTLDRGELGTMSPSGLFTPSGALGGTAIVSAEWGGRRATTTLRVLLVREQNGAATQGASDAGAGGAGGNGGVGGEGEGAPVDATTLATLRSPPAASTGLAFLYPYNNTVWPRGVLAPLLQWTPGAQATFDAVRITLTEDFFRYEGVFQKTATPFARHPIPQPAWAELLRSNAGEPVTVSLTFSKNGVAYGPITETWKIASGSLKGTVYYNSYGTRLAKNLAGAMGPGDGMFGGATLAIKSGATDPVIAAGGSGSAEYCRVCHSVSANGQRLIAQRNFGALRRFTMVDLTSGIETSLTPSGGTSATTQARFAWPAIYKDGSMFLGDSSTADGSADAPNTLYAVPTGGATTPTAIMNTGWPAGFRAAFPAFSPGGERLAFTMFAGAPGADTRTLGMMSFDATTKSFGPLTPIFVPLNPAHRALFPSFLPTNDRLVFQLETRWNGRGYGETRSDCDKCPTCGVCTKNTLGTRAELWYLDLRASPPTARRLDALNGVGYVPTGAKDHDDDATLNYEPTVNPVMSGGYAWVVFTSRRLYGNVATAQPFASDPRYYDLTSTPTTKKLWVAAIDLNAAPGEDPSHPAFYLPGQELLAGNMRGYWVVDPCKENGTSCGTGDECCGGYCRSQDGGLVCTGKPSTCAQEFEACASDGDCCGAPSYRCIGGRCSLPEPK